MEKETIKLLPCPFDGSKPVKQRNGASFSVFCPQCLVSTLSGHSMGVAIERWNKRVDNDLQSRYDQLEKAFEKSIILLSETQPLAAESLKEQAGILK